MDKKLPEDLEQQAEADTFFSLDKIITFSQSLPSKRVKWAKYSLLANHIKDVATEAAENKESELTVYYMKDYVGVVDRRDILHYVKCDKEYKAAITKLNAAKRMCVFVDKVQSAFKECTFDISNIIKREIFQNGG